MLAPGDDPEAAETSSRGPRGKRRVESDDVCPWCGSQRLHIRKKMPSPKGPGVLAYIFFPVALTYWLTSTTYNDCLDCGGHWQRGVLIAPRPPPEPDRPPAPEERAGMYAEQVPTPAIVRRRPRLGSAAPALIPSGDVELHASPGACRACWQAAGRYDARDVPTLPIPGCTCEGGCHCTVVPTED